MTLDELIDGLQKLRSAYFVTNSKPVDQVNIIVSGMNFEQIAYLPLTGITVDDGQLCLIAKKKALS